MEDQIAGLINDSIAVKQRLLYDRTLIKEIQKVAKLLVHTINNGNKIMFAGNGGSAADAQHLAGELISRLNYNRSPIAGMALTTDTSILTAIGNDYGYEEIFARQISGLALAGDVFFAISTSGNSENILKAIEVANDCGITSVGLTGKEGGLLRKECKSCICVPSDNTARIQEAHIMVGHILCDIIEKECRREVG